MVNFIIRIVYNFIIMPEGHYGKVNIGYYCFIKMYIKIKKDLEILGKKLNSLKNKHQ